MRAVVINQYCCFSKISLQSLKCEVLYYHVCKQSWAQSLLHMERQLVIVSDQQNEFGSFSDTDSSSSHDEKSALSGHCQGGLYCLVSSLSAVVHFSTKNVSVFTKIEHPDFPMKAVDFFIQARCTVTAETATL